MAVTTVAPNIVVIPARSEWLKERFLKRLRVAAYCRVSTDDEEQLTSYEAQQTYYTDKIMANPEWTMAGIYADEGITGTKATKRPEFLKMIRKCKKKQIDIILVKSISRFARNTVDCLYYIRMLKGLGIAVIFEKENINTLNEDSEMLTTIMGAFAQAESESISQNVKWGIRQAMKEGRAHIQFDKLYGYAYGDGGKPIIIESKAEVVRYINDRFLSGYSFRMLKTELEEKKIAAPNGGDKWSISVIRNILKNEKYCGDVLMQKTFISDPISGKKVNNTGQLPMYLKMNNHPAIISRETRDAVQAELARRTSGKAPSTKLAPTGRSCYSGKYALTERIVCGECGSLYRRCVWNKRGQKRPVWRCASRIDYGSKYCHKSPTIYEIPLKAAILEAINSVMSEKKVLISQIKGAMQMELSPESSAHTRVADFDNKIQEQQERFNMLFEAVKNDAGEYLKYATEFQTIHDEISRLKEKKIIFLDQQKTDSVANKRIEDAVKLLESCSAKITEWDEGVIRQLVDHIKVLAEDSVLICLRGGIEIKKYVEKG